MNPHDGVKHGFANGEVPAADEVAGLVCPVSKQQPGVNLLGPGLCGELQDAGCPMAADLYQRLQFETLLTDLSSRLVNVAANQVDSQINWGLRRIVELFGIDRSGLGEVSPDGKLFQVTHSYQVSGVPPSANLKLDSQFPFFSRRLRQGVVLRLPDDLPPEATEELEYCRQTGLKSNVTIPLTVMGTTVGGIGFSSFHSRRFLQDELIPRLRLVGDIFTHALSRKRADEALRAKEYQLRQAKHRLRQLNTKLLVSQEEERSRIAREMHDDWTQRLALLGIDAAKLENQLGPNDSVLPLVQAMRNRLVSLAEDVHELSRQLHPSIIQDLGLANALQSECASFLHREGIKVDYVPENVPASLPNDVALCLYRIAQEALRNIAKHAAVNKASVRLSTEGQNLRLQVRDHGLGFLAEDASTHPGIGLSSMMERVQLVNGTLEIQSEPGQGTTVDVHVPLEEFPHA